MLEARELAWAATAAVAVAPFRAIVSVAGNSDLDLPAPGRVARRAGDLVLWAGAQSWLVMSDDGGLEARWRGVAGEDVALTDQSDGKVVIFVRGVGARKILSKLLPIDLDEAVFLENSTALTLAGHIPVQVWREDGKFALACFRSFAESLYHALVQAEKGSLVNG